MDVLLLLGNELLILFRQYQLLKKISIKKRKTINLSKSSEAALSKQRIRLNIVFEEINKTDIFLLLEIKNWWIFP